MKKIHLFILSIAGALMFQSCQSPEQRAGDQKDGLTPKKELAKQQQNEQGTKQKEDGQSDGQGFET